MNLGLCTISNLDCSVEEVVRIASDAGYDGVEICGRDAHLGDASEERCRELAAVVDEVGVEIHVYGSYLRPGTDAFEGAYDRELTVANALGASLIRVWAGEQEYDEASDDHWRRTVADLRTLAEAAAERDLAVTTERHAGTLTNTTDGAREVVEAVDHDHCSLNWQPNFAHDAEEVVDDARELAPYSNNVHLMGAYEPDGGERSPLEEAYFECERVLDAFGTAGFDGYVEVEFVTDAMDYESAVSRDREYLASILS